MLFYNTAFKCWLDIDFSLLLMIFLFSSNILIPRWGMITEDFALNWWRYSRLFLFFFLKPILEQKWLVIMTIKHNSVILHKPWCISYLPGVILKDKLVQFSTKISHKNLTFITNCSIVKFCTTFFVIYLKHELTFTIWYFFFLKLKGQFFH